MRATPLPMSSKIFISVSEVPYSVPTQDGITIKECEAVFTKSDQVSPIQTASLSKDEIYKSTRTTPSPFPK